MRPHKNKSCMKLPQLHNYSISCTCTYMYHPASYCNKIKKKHDTVNQPFFSEVLVVYASVHLMQIIWAISGSWLSLSLADQVGSVLCTKTWQEEHQLFCQSDLSKTKHYFTNRKSQHKRADAACSSNRRWQYAVTLTTLNTRDPAKVSMLPPTPRFFVCLFNITDVLSLNTSVYKLLKGI